MKYKLESRLLGEIPVTSHMQMTLPLMAESEEELKRKVKEESAKADLKLNIQKTRIRPMVLSLHGKQREKKWKQ